MFNRPSSPPDRRRLLRIHLNDQLAVATGVLARARRTQRSNAGTSLGAFLEQLADEMAADRDTLVELMGHLQMPVDRIKVTLAGVGEKLGTAKLNGSLVRYSDLSRVLDLEALCAGIELKRNLWLSLGASSATRDRLAEGEWQRLVDRADVQRRDLESHRLEAARRAFG